MTDGFGWIGTARQSSTTESPTGRIRAGLSTSVDERQPERDSLDAMTLGPSAADRVSSEEAASGGGEHGKWVVRGIGIEVDASGDRTMLAMYGIDGEYGTDGEHDVADEAGRPALTLVEDLDAFGAQIDTSEEQWQERALCAQTDPEAFFPEKGGSTREAKRICQGCQVKDECLDYALEHDERFGIWGGLSERERRRIKRGII